MKTAKQTETELALADNATPPLADAALMRQDIADGSPVAMLRQLQAMGATPETVSKLMDLHERWTATEARKAFYTAMADFQAKCPVIPRVKTVKNRDEKLMYSYAPLETILATIRAPENACGFRHSWDVEELDNGGVRVVCRISHRDGHSEESRCVMPPTKGLNTNEAQNKGIIISYGQRRSLLNGYGLATGGEDNDARPPEEPSTPIGPREIAHIRECLKTRSRTEESFCQWAGVKTLDELPEAQFVDRMKQLGWGLPK
jgi:hypothetical protein